MGKLNWFLRDFGYDTEMLGRDEVDETQLVSLKGVVKISNIFFNGASLLRLDGFAPAARWDELAILSSLAKRDRVKFSHYQP